MVQCSPVQKGFFLNPELDPGLVQAFDMNLEPLRGPVWFRSSSWHDEVEP